MYKAVKFFLVFCENIIKIKLPLCLYFEENVCLGAPPTYLAFKKKNTKKQTLSGQNLDFTKNSSLVKCYSYTRFPNNK